MSCEWSRQMVFLCHVIVLSLLSYKIYLKIETSILPFERGVQKQVLTLFLRQNARDYSTDPLADDHNIFLFTINETIHHLHSLHSNYYSIPAKALGSFRFGSIPPRLFVYFHDEHGKKVQKPVEYQLPRQNSTNWPIGLQLNDTWLESRKFFFEKLNSMRMDFTLMSISMMDERDASEKKSNQIEWAFSFLYDFKSQGQIHVIPSVKAFIASSNTHYDQKGEIAFKNTNLDNSLSTVDICLLFFVIVYELLLITAGAFSMKEIQNEQLNSQKVNLLKMNCSAGEEDSSESPRNSLISDSNKFNNKYCTKNAFFLSFGNAWFILISLCNIILIICLAKEIEIGMDMVIYEQKYRFLYSISCALHWVTLIQYYKRSHSLRYRILTITLTKGFPRVFTFLIGVFPIFVGYVFFGTIMFGSESSRFRSIGVTATTLFAFVNGDEIRDTYVSLNHNPVCSQIYLYSFMILFSYVVLMVCIGIIQDAFLTAIYENNELESTKTPDWEAFERNIKTEIECYCDKADLNEQQHKNILEVQHIIMRNVHHEFNFASTATK